MKDSVPKLCEILGVKPYQDFTINGFEGSFFIDDVGLIGSNKDYYAVNSYRILEALCDAVENSDNVKPLSRWTKKNIEDAKKIKDLFPWAKSISRITPENFEIRCGNEGDSKCCIVFNTQMFQTLNAGEKVLLDEIIGGNENDD